MAGRPHLFTAGTQVPTAGASAFRFPVVVECSLRNVKTLQSQSSCGGDAHVVHGARSLLSPVSFFFYTRIPPRDCILEDGGTGQAQLQGRDGDGLLRPRQEKKQRLQDQSN